MSPYNGKKVYNVEGVVTALDKTALYRRQSAR